MSLRDDVDLLVDYGLFNEDAIGRIANALRTVRDLAGGNAVRRGPGRRGRRPGRPAGSGRGPGRPRGAGKRAPRGSFNPSKDELAKMRATMTAKEIAEKHGVSTATVNIRARALGLTTPRKKRKK
jgi:hypothetical protein